MPMMRKEASTALVTVGVSEGGLGYLLAFSILCCAGCLQGIVSSLIKLGDRCIYSTVADWLDCDGYFQSSLLML